MKTSQVNEWVCMKFPSHRTAAKQLHFYPDMKPSAGPSQRIQKWSDGRSHRVPKAREGGEQERKYYSPLVRGVWGVSSRKYLNFGCFYVRFKWDFYAFGTRFQPYWSRSFANKDISCHMRNRMLDKIVFGQSQFFFYSTFL